MKTGDKEMMSFLPEGFLLDSKENKEYLSSIDNFMKAFYEKRVLESKVTYCDCNHNLHLDFGFIQGIIPRESCALGIKDGTTKDIAIIARVNKPVKFIIERFEEFKGKKTAILNRCVVQESFKNSFLKSLKAGDIIDAKVTHLENFGAFCDIGCGINALLPIDNISVSRIPHPNVRFTPGDNIKVIIKSFDDLGRITLSHKELLGTWEENAKLFNVGETVSGVIRSIENYGIFVELTPNLSGLAEYTSDVFENQQASVFIKSIIPDKMKFKLIIVDSFDAKTEIKAPKYFYKGNHIDYFKYSPDTSQKVIETDF